jgi:cytochrome c-550 PedF
MLEFGMIISRLPRAVIAAAAVSLAAASAVFAHGDVTPQPIDTAGLKEIGKEWLLENPYRDDPKAIEIGTSGYNQNCARCHGLEVISGGMAPDLRYLEKGKVGDEWYIQRVRNGAKKSDGTTIMPGFESVFSQEAMWAIRAYIESVHEE